MKDSYLVKKKADEIIVADMSGGIKKEEIMAFNDTLNQTVKGVVSVVENVSSTYRDVSMISAQVEVEYKRLDHALDCLMLKAQRDIQIYQDTLPLLEQNFNSMQNRMDRLMDRALDLISDDCSEESLSRQEAVMKLIEITNESLNKLIVKSRLFHLTLMLQCATVNQVVICSSYAMAVLISFWIKGLMAFN